MEEMLELALKKISTLEKRVEKYYSMLNINNELDFVMKGSYYLEENLNKIMMGDYEVEETV